MSVDGSVELAALRKRQFLENVEWARSCGYRRVCSECGCGIEDDSDTHEYWCLDYQEAPR